ncbi:hypothetical protein CVS40_5144 [Lucilia cuprina]|nr:hypothetical protein CVS40_5144 [Lucilia cuprina]
MVKSRLGQGSQIKIIILYEANFTTTTIILFEILEYLWKTPEGPFTDLRSIPPEHVGKFFLSVETSPRLKKQT